MRGLTVFARPENRYLNRPQTGGIRA
jgi:hypothetical protein